jgi:hypothetical protein
MKMVCMRVFFQNGWSDYDPNGNLRETMGYGSLAARMFAIQNFLNSIQLSNYMSMVHIHPDTIVYYAEHTT